MNSLEILSLQYLLWIYLIALIGMFGISRLFQVFLVKPILSKKMYINQLIINLINNEIFNLLRLT